MMGAVLLPGAPARKRLDALQSRLSAVSEQRKVIADAPPSVADMRADKQAEVARLQHRVPRPSLEGSANETVSMAAHRLESLMVALVGVDRTVDVLCEQELAALAGKPHGLPRAERAKAIAKLDAERAELERQEELATLDLEAQGHFIVRRGDINGKMIVYLWRELHADARQATT